MPFIQGQSGNPNGKPLGTKNKTSNHLRELITDFLSENFEKVRDDFETLSPKERTKLYCDLLQYGLPKLQSVNLETTGDNLKPIIIDWS